MNLWTQKTIQNTELTGYRGNPNYWEHNNNMNLSAKRILRLIDIYLPLRNPQNSQIKNQKSLVNITATRFLRPYSHVEKPLWSVRFQRIKHEMKQAMHNGYPYHLWWHPHNFGINLNANMNMLRQILDFHAKLNKNGKMPSLTMLEYANKVIK